mmetsp:Transcript_18531/g.25600  ORF Transcript_18531/g.25600 Transcript_18531/m.25600 type:complete len:108 (+) Transcript_18531:554-877(+)
MADVQRLPLVAKCVLAIPAGLDPLVISSRVRVRLAQVMAHALQLAIPTGGAPVRTASPVGAAAIIVIRLVALQTLLLIRVRGGSSPRRRWAYALKVAAADIHPWEVR